MISRKLLYFVVNGTRSYFCTEVLAVRGYQQFYVPRSILNFVEVLRINHSVALLSTIKKKKRTRRLSVGQRKKKIVQEARQVARELLDYETVPLGSYTSEHFQNSKKALIGLKFEKGTNAESVSLAINLLKRYVFELDGKCYEKCFTKNLRWLRSNHGTCLNRIFVNWKTALFAQKKVISADELMQTLSEMIDKVPEYSVPQEVVEIILEAAIHQAKSRADAAVTAEAIFNYFKRLSEPNANVYNLMIIAWGKSGLFGFDRKIEQLVTRMYALQTQPNMRTYHLLMELWAELGRVNSLEETVVKMQKNAFLLPDIFCYWHACRCYETNGFMGKARFYFDKMLEVHDPLKCSHVDLVKNAAIDIIKAYHRFASDERQFNVERMEALRHSKEFILTLQETGKVAEEIIDHLLIVHKEQEQQSHTLDPTLRQE